MGAKSMRSWCLCQICTCPESATHITLSFICFLSSQPDHIRIPVPFFGIRLT
uniref:Stabilizer of axonemal microtubules 2 n=2 Tax=Cercopithecinae TaxID=9528 RepID=A0A2K5M9H9_CERAT